MFQEDASSLETVLLKAEDVAVSMLSLDLILVFLYTVALTAMIPLILQRRERLAIGGFLGPLSDDCDTTLHSNNYVC